MTYLVKETVFIVKYLQHCYFLVVLTRLFPMHPFSTPWKHQKTVRFSDIFRGWRKGALRTNGLIERYPRKFLFQRTAFSLQSICFRSSRRGVLYEKVFFEISQNSQENTCGRVLRPATLLKKRPWYKCFPVNFVKNLRTPFFIEHLWWLLLLLPKH